MAAPNLIVITGPTASGKTSFAAYLAKRIGGEIISADSRQVYRGMDLGTGKDYDDYAVDGVKIPYHLIDIKPAGYKYNVFEFQQDFNHAFREIQSRGRMPILAGGTGLYIEAVTQRYNLKPVPAHPALRQQLDALSHVELIRILKELKPELHNTTDLTSKKRTIRAIEIARHEGELQDNADNHPIINPIMFGLAIDREIRRKRISERLRVRLEQGMISEVEKLLESVPAEDLLFYGLEYKFITQYLIGEISYAEMFRQLEIAIHQFAKRQMTWFRKMERDGIQIHWIDAALPLAEKLEQVVQTLKAAGFSMNFQG